MHIHSNIFKKKIKLDYYKKKKYNFTQKQDNQQIFQQQQKILAHKKGTENNFKSPSICKKKRKNFEIIDKNFKSFWVKNFFFKTVLIKLCQYKRESSRFQCFFSFGALLFISRAFDLNFSLFCFESFLIFLKFRKNTCKSFFSLSYYTSKLKIKKKKIFGKKSFFIVDFFSKEKILIRRKLIETRLVYNLRNYFNESKTINLIYRRWVIFKKYFIYKKILKTSFLFFDKKKVKFFRKRKKLI